MVGPAKTCVPTVDTPSGAARFHLTWFRSWPITFDINDSIAVWLDAVARVRSAGGTIIDIIFYDDAGNQLGDGGMCTAVVNPPAPPPPPHPPPTTGGDNDELDVGFGNILIELRAIIQLIQNFTTGQTQPIDYSQCCHAIVLELMALVKIAQQIELKMSAPGAAPPPPIDLSAVLAELTCICESSSSSAAATSSIAQNLPPSLKAIADAITSSKPTDVSGIVEQLKKLFKTLDTPKAVYDQLVKDGFLDSKYAQLAAGGDTAPGAVAVSATWWDRLIKRLAEGSGGTSTFGLSPRPPTPFGVKEQLPEMFKSFISASDTRVLPIIQPIIETLQKQLLPKGPVSTGIINVDPDVPVATAVSVALTSAIAAWLVSYLGWDAGEPLAHMAELVAGMIGFEELRDVQIGPLIQRGIAKVADNNARATFRQEVPGATELAGLAARGLITTAQWEALHGYSGLPGELTQATLAGAETGLQPFILLRLAGTGLFTDRDLVDEMTFRGVRPASQHRILLAAPYVATQKERDALRGTLEKGYTQGFFADADFTDRINQIEQLTDRATLIMDKVRLERAFAGAKDLESAYETEFLAGITDAPQYQSKLAGIGLQPDYVAYLMAKAEAHANARLVRQAAAAERALVKATAAEERRAALTQYQAGTLNEAGLSTALVATGLTPIQAAAWVAQALGQRAGKLRLVYGLRLSPAESTLLRQRVADLMKQRELQMLTDNQFVQGLQALKIPPTFVNALRAGANAALKPKTAAILTPVATS